MDNPARCHSVDPPRFSPAQCEPTLVWTRPFFRKRISLPALLPRRDRVVIRVTTGENVQFLQFHCELLSRSEQRGSRFFHAFVSGYEFMRSRWSSGSDTADCCSNSPSMSSPVHPSKWFSTKRFLSGSHKCCVGAVCANNFSCMLLTKA